MTGSVMKSDPELLANFYIFCDELGLEEGQFERNVYVSFEIQEKEKILFYYPETASSDQQIRNVGLSQAIINFTKTFTSDQPCEYLHTLKTKQYFYEAEPGIWMVMTLKVPSAPTKITNKGSVADDEGARLEYFPDEIWDNVYQAVLKQSYQMFRLFSGRFSTILRHCPPDISDSYDYLRQRLFHFFPKYLASLRLEESDLSTLFQGIQFLPLDPNSFLRIQTLVNRVEETFPGIRRSIFFYDDFLVWSGLDMEDMQVMYRYLTTGLFPSCPRHPETTNVPQAPIAASRGWFLTGPPDLADGSNLGKIPLVTVRDEKSSSCDGSGSSTSEEVAGRGEDVGDYGREHQLIVYRAKDATMCFLFEGTAILDINLFRRLDAFLGHQLAALSEDISDSIRRKSLNVLAADTVFKYVYFNKVNSALKSTIVVDAARKPMPIGPAESFAGGNPPAEVLRFFPQLHQDLHFLGQNSEMSVKLHNDYWVIGKRADQREVYIVLSQRNYGLLEATDEVTRLFASQFSNIFFE